MCPRYFPPTKLIQWDSFLGEGGERDKTIYPNLQFWREIFQTLSRCHLVVKCVDIEVANQSRFSPASPAAILMESFNFLYFIIGKFSREARAISVEIYARNCEARMMGDTLAHSPPPRVSMAITTSSVVSIYTKQSSHRGQGLDLFRKWPIFAHLTMVSPPPSNCCRCMINEFGMQVRYIQLQGRDVCVCVCSINHVVNRVGNSPRDKTKSEPRENAPSNQLHLVV